MSKELNSSGNPLFSPANTLNFTPNALFMPVQEQASAILTPEKDIEEEDHFIGQASSGSEQQNVATFTMFSQSETPSDPFASIPPSSIRDGVLGNPHLSAGVITSEEQEPHLFVPSPTTQHTGIADGSYSPSGMPPPLHSAVNTTPAARNNPYSRVFAGGHRPAYPPATQFFQPSNVAPPVLQGPPPQSVRTEEQHLANIPSSNSQHGMSGNASTITTTTTQMHDQLYQAVVPYWFYCKNLEHENKIWCPFSREDSKKLEAVFQAETSGNIASDSIITDGGRYDVYVAQRQRKSIYWDEPMSSVRRCTWFCKADSENLYSPYEESIADKLEEDYQNIVTTGLWHKGIEIPNAGGTVVVHNPQLIMHFQPDPHRDDFGSVIDRVQQSKIVKRGILATEFAKDIPEDEVGTPDHVVFVCHGIGPVCDLRSRTIVECVDDVRAIQLTLLQSHFKHEVDSNKAKRIEFLPIHWHQALHGDASGVDRNIRRLTLPSICRLRQFTNETLLDILFYSSPVYSQTIAETIGNEINALYQRFVSRNPTFTGKVSLAGHSLGSLILFDLLCHQVDSLNVGEAEMHSTMNTSIPAEMSSNNLKQDTTDGTQPVEENVLTIEATLQKLNLENFLTNFEQEQIDMDSLLMCSESDFKDMGLPLGPRKKLSGFLKDHRENEIKQKELEATKALYTQSIDNIAAASTETQDQSSYDQLEPQFGGIGTFLSSATNVHVDFQQFDSGTGQPAVCYPKLEFDPQYLFALGSPIGMFLTVRGIAELGEDFSLPTCPNFINIFHPFDPVAYRIEPLINPESTLNPVQVPHYKGRKRLHLELKESLGRMGQELKQGIMKSVRLAIGSMQKFAKSHWNQQQNSEAEVEEEVEKMTNQILSEGHDHANENVETASATSDGNLDDVGFGKLNCGRRIDYVLQERPLESFNDYLFAFQSHLCYWNNEDTVLLMMKEIYGSMGVYSDNQLAKNKLVSTGLPAGAIAFNTP